MGYTGERYDALVFRATSADSERDSVDSLVTSSSCSACSDASDSVNMR